MNLTVRVPAPPPEFDQLRDAYLPLQRDGTSLTCGPGTVWRRGGVPAGTPSPDCGHTYTYADPSLPEGRYTIAATTHWSVAWAAGGQSGTIPFTQTTTTTLPVGEVQTLVR